MGGSRKEIMEFYLLNTLCFLKKIGKSVEGLRSRNRSVPGGYNKAVFEKALKVAKQQRRNEIAPGNIIKAVEAANLTPFQEGINTEALLFQELIGPQSRALQHMFFSERLASKVDNISKSAKAVPIKSLGIIGAGLMGGGIAMSAANVGISVFLIDVNQAAVDNGLKLIVSNYNRYFLSLLLSISSFSFLFLLLFPLSISFLLASPSMPGVATNGCTLFLSFVRPLSCNSIPLSPLPLFFFSNGRTKLFTRKTMVVVMMMGGRGCVWWVGGVKIKIIIKRFNYTRSNE